ncbi:hypothetical protein I317_05741 [Kwoniella heveanensis CBS 569]|nr:hypothetical protein I317_05741 [Kwoniella heveanensis CBS 569]
MSAHAEQGARDSRLSRSNMTARSTPPPPYHLASPPSSSSAAIAEPKSPHQQPIDNSTPPPSLPHSHYRSNADQSSEASSSRPPIRRASSSSSTTAHSTFSRSSIYPTPDLSTAPTTPSASTPIPTQRTWRPTSNVPHHVHQRHRRVASGAEEVNRWLSEDEGLGSESICVSTGRRRRRRRSTMERDRDGPGDDGDGGGPSSVVGRSVGSPGVKVQSTEDAINVIARAKNSSTSTRPRPSRARSFETPSSTVVPRAPSPLASMAPSAPQYSGIGLSPPRIEQLIPPPSVTEARVGLGITTVPAASRSEGLSIGPSVAGIVPDFARGRGGDGIGGVHLPATYIGDIESAAVRRAKRKAVVEKLRKILGCALCPPIDGAAPLLHHPITFPCGHTLSANHISIPAPPPLHFTNEAPHEIFAAQQRQHQQRLALWSGVMCPIPSCKRYSPNANLSGPMAYVGVDDVESDSLPNAAMTSASHRSGLLASGVSYYPPPQAPAPPPAYSPEAPVNENGSPLLDICVDKIMLLVQREMENEDIDENERMRGDETDVTDSSDDDEEIRPTASQSSLTRDFALLASPSRSSRSLLGAGSSGGAELTRTASKRRRHHHRPAQRARATLDQTRNNVEWPFEKELMGTLECDVCAMLLYEPVTTPCQHDHPVNKVILSIIKTTFPDEYAERAQAIERDERDARLDTPIFVCTLAFPGMPTILHVFEPRYRLMIRRCIESPSPRFGMVLPARGTGAPQLQGVMEYGTMLEIQSVQMLPDGRSMVETVGTHRFKLLEKGSLDGYTVGRIERIDDVSPEEEIAMERQAVERATSSRATKAATSDTPGPSTAGPDAGSSGQLMSIPLLPASESGLAGAQPPMPAAPSMGMGTGLGMGVPGAPGAAGSMDFGSLAAQSAAAAPGTAPPSVEDTPETTEELMAICRAFIDQLRSGSAPWLLQRLNNTYGVMPTDPSEFSYWMALVMPIDEYEKANLLPIRSPRLRLKLIVHWVETLRTSWW